MKSQSGPPDETSARRPDVPVVPEPERCVAPSEHSDGAAVRLAAIRLFRSSAIPVASVVLAVPLFCGVVGDADSIGRYGRLIGSSTDSAGDRLAELVGNESESNVALREDGTLQIETFASNPAGTVDPAAWIATTDPATRARVEVPELPELPVGTPVHHSEQAPPRAEAMRASPVVTAGIAVSNSAHVSIVPPFVVLSRGAESILLSLESGSRVVPEQRLPSWAWQDHRDSHVVADFGWRGSVEVHARSVSVRRRSLAWALPDSVI